MSTIKTWVERLPDGVRFCPSTTEMIPAMREEIAELRAALAASGGNAAPGLTDEQIGEIADNYKFKEHYRSNSEAIEFARECIAASAPNAALVAAAQATMAWWSEHQYDTVSDGEGGEYNVFDSEPEFVKSARTALSAAGQEVGHG